MEDKLFDTDEKKQTAIGHFKSLLDHPGWQLLVKVIDANIEVIKRQIIEGTDEETTESINRLRDKLKIHENVKNTPRDFIRSFTGVEGEEPRTDPFETVEELREDQKKLA